MVDNICRPTLEVNGQLALWQGRSTYTLIHRVIMQTGLKTAHISLHVILAVLCRP